MYSVESTYKEWKRFTRHFWVATGSAIIDGVINYPMGKNIYPILVHVFSLLFILAVFYLLYKKSVKEKIDYCWLIRWPGIFMLDNFITMGICLNIPAIIYAIFTRKTTYVYYIDSTYGCIINMITFIIILVYCVHLKMNLKINNTLLYVWFFIMYSGSVLFHFAPEKLQLAVLQFIHRTSNPDILHAAVNYYKPGIKEAVLAFIILDASDIIPKLQDIFNTK